MEFFIIEGVFCNPCPVDKQALEKSVQDHLAYLEKGFEDGSILVSGPKSMGDGGFIIMRAKSEDDIFDFLENDPMKLLGVQNYIVNAFEIHKTQPLASEWFTS